MRLKYAPLLAAVFSFAVAQSALAADMPVKAAPVIPSPVYDWSGVYVGAQIGYEWANVTDVCTVGCFPVGFTENSTYRTWDAGIHAGIQKQFGQWVLGIEGAGNFPLGDNSQSNYNSCAGPAFHCGLRRIDSQVTIGGKLGYAWDRWLLSALGGWATANLNRADYLVATGAYCAGGTCVTGRANGWYAGGALEYMFMQAAFVDIIGGLDYKYVRLNDAALNDPAGGTHVMSENLNMVDLRLTFKFKP